MAERPPPPLPLFGTSPKARKELYGPPQTAVCGDSTVLTGSTSDLNQSYPLDPSLRRGLIRREHSGLSQVQPSKGSLCTFDRAADTSRQLRPASVLEALLWMLMEMSRPALKVNRS